MTAGCNSILMMLLFRMLTGVLYKDVGFLFAGKPKKEGEYLLCLQSQLPKEQFQSF